MWRSPEDQATADALRRLADDGSDMTKPMSVDFFVAVPNRAAGESVSPRAIELGFSTSVERDDSGTWTCYCTKTIVPSFENVRAIEKQLDVIARAYGGHADGFGSFGNAPKVVT